MKFPQTDRGLLSPELELFLQPFGETELNQAASNNETPEIPRKKIRELMQIHPNSSIAFALLGTLEYKSGNIRAAIESTEKAIQLLRMGLDKTALKYQSRHSLEDMTGNLTANVNAWRRQLK